jgi:gas vesicle protein
MHIFSHHEYEQKIRRFPFMSKAKSFITGVICGGAVAGLAVLFSTPSSGKAMRGKLKEKGNDIKKTLADITADTKLLKRQIVETASEGKEVFQELKEDMQDTLSNWKQDISQNKRHIEQEILDIQKSIEKLQEAVPEKA